MASSSAHKAGERGKEVEDSQSDGVYFPKSPLNMVEPCFTGGV